MVSPCLYVSPCSKNLWGLVQKAQGSVVQPLCVAQVIEHPEHNEQSLKFEPQNEDLKIQIQNRDITNSQVKPAEGLELMSPDSPYPGAIQKKNANPPGSARRWASFDLKDGVTTHFSCWNMLEPYFFLVKSW